MTVWYPNEITILDVREVSRHMGAPIAMTVETLVSKGLLTSTDFVLTPQDYVEVRGAAIRDYVALPYRCRMRGMIVDLNDDEMRALAYMNATIEMLSRKGLLDPKTVMGPSVYTEVQDVVAEDTYGVSLTQQKD
jgi:hypothetical protein